MSESRRINRPSSLNYGIAKPHSVPQLFKTNKPDYFSASTTGIAASAAHHASNSLQHCLGNALAISQLSTFNIASSSPKNTRALKFGWDLLASRTVKNVSAFKSIARENEITGGWDITLSTELKQHQTATRAPQFFVDFFAVRLSEYDLKQRDLFTNATDLIELGGEAYIPSPLFYWGNYQLTKLPAAPLASSITMRAYQPPAKSDDVSLPWGVGVSLHHAPELLYIVEPEIIVPGEVPAAHKQEVYIIMNSVNVKAVLGNEPLSVADIVIDLDEDSYSWKISASVLNQQSVDLMKPDANGYKEIEVSINGHVWIFFITTWQRSRSINQNKLDKKYQVTGYSRTQYLGTPYAPKRTKSIGSTTAVQAALEELTGTGFTLNWNVSDLPDWAMLNSVFSYQELTPLQVIKRLAKTVGAVVLPAMADDELTVMPRDRIAPWDMELAAIDRTVHESQILREGGTLQAGAKINAVRVSGEQQGVDMNVVRQGTAGDIPGADVVDGWLSASEANTSRGRAEIAASGNVEINTLELAIPETASQPGLLLPGLYVAVQHNEASSNYRAKVTSVSISVPGRGLVKVRQSVVLQRYVAWESVT